MAEIDKFSEASSMTATDSTGKEDFKRMLSVTLSCGTGEDRGAIDYMSERSTPVFDSGRSPLMREYRTRLITDVVTGKFDVREAAARLPEEIEESEPLDESEVANDDEEAADDLDAAPEEAEA